MFAPVCAYTHRFVLAQQASNARKVLHNGSSLAHNNPIRALQQRHLAKWAVAWKQTNTHTHRHICIPHTLTLTPPHTCIHTYFASYTAHSHSRTIRLHLRPVLACVEAKLFRPLPFHPRERCHQGRTKALCEHFKVVQLVRFGGHSTGCGRGSKKKDRPEGRLLEHEWPRTGPRAVFWSTSGLHDLPHIISLLSTKCKPGFYFSQHST